MTLTKVKVLLIEDDEDDYILTTELLNEVKSTGYDVTWVSRCMDAMSAIQAGGIDVCLVDYRLGECDGISIIAEAKSKNLSVPMILLTGQGDANIDMMAAEAGAADYLIKGEIDPQLLERSIRYSIANATMVQTMLESELRFRSVV